MTIQTSRLTDRFAGLNREKLGSVNMSKKERWASLLGGAALAALALRGGRRSKGVAGLAVLAGVAGLPLILRGATGHCPVHQKMGIDHTEGSGQGTALASEHVSTEAPPTF